MQWTLLFATLRRTLWLHAWPIALARQRHSRTPQHSGHTTNGTTSTNGRSTNGHSCVNGHSTPSNGHSTSAQWARLKRTQPTAIPRTARGSQPRNGHSRAPARVRAEARRARGPQRSQRRYRSPTKQASQSTPSSSCLTTQQECLTAAFDAMSDKLLQITADPDLVGQDWPRAVRKAIGALMHHLATHPLPRPDDRHGGLRRRAGRDRAQLRARPRHRHAAHRGGPREWPTTSSRSMLSPGRSGTPSAARSPVNRSQRLPALSDYLAYVVLAPFIGYRGGRRDRDRGAARPRRASCSLGRASGGGRSQRRLRGWRSAK